MQKVMEVVCWPHLDLVISGIGLVLLVFLIAKQREEVGGSVYMREDLRIRAKYVRLRHASARGVQQKWKSQYTRSDGSMHERWKEIYDRLLDLGGNPPIEKVAEITGNKLWSYISCDGCNDSVEVAVEIGDYEARAYCATCISEAHSIIAPYPSQTASSEVPP